MVITVSRRRFLNGGLLVFTPAVACQRNPHGASAPDAAQRVKPPPAPAAREPVQAVKPMPYGAGPPPEARPSDPSGECIETPDNIEGPYYRAGAPLTSDLTRPGLRGTPLVLSGRVFELGCSKGITGATLDVWQADTQGHYDNDGSATGRGGEMRLRGKVRVGADGRFSLRTIVPGRYLNGPTYRPAHVHVKITAPGFAPLTTQLYFPRDPYNDSDPWIREPLIMKVDDVPGRKEASFDFVLRRA